MESYRASRRNCHQIGYLPPNPQGHHWYVSNIRSSKLLKIPEVTNSFFLLDEIDRTRQFSIGKCFSFLEDNIEKYRLRSSKQSSDSAESPRSYKEQMKISHRRRCNSIVLDFLEVYSYQSIIVAGYQYQ